MAKKRPVSTSSKTLPPAGIDLEIVDNIPQLPATPKGLKAEPAPGFTVYKVNRAIGAIGHMDKAYPIKDGLVDLPTGELWYADLIKNGVLTPA